MTTEFNFGLNFVYNEKRGIVISTDPELLRVKLLTSSAATSSFRKKPLELTNLPFGRLVHIARTQVLAETINL